MQLNDRQLQMQIWMQNTKKFLKYVRCKSDDKVHFIAACGNDVSRRNCIFGWEFLLSEMRIKILMTSCDIIMYDSNSYCQNIYLIHTVFSRSRRTISKQA